VISKTRAQQTPSLTLITGGTGCGKTWLATHIVRQMIGRIPQIIVLEKHDEYGAPLQRSRSLARKKTSLRVVKIRSAHAARNFLRALYRNRSTQPLENGRQTHVLLVLDGWSAAEMKPALPLFWKRRELLVSILVVGQDLADLARELWTTPPKEGSLPS
jgi:DNA replication protein DnaC